MLDLCLFCGVLMLTCCLWVLTPSFPGFGTLVFVWFGEFRAMDRIGFGAWSDVLGLCYLSLGLQFLELV